MNVHELSHMVLVYSSPDSDQLENLSDIIAAGPCTLDLPLLHLEPLRKFWPFLCCDRHTRH